MLNIDWGKVLHYGAGLGLLALGVLGEIGVPGINATVCFTAGATYLAGGEAAKFVHK